MDSEYKIEPRQLGQPTRGTPALVAVVVASLFLVIAKPWQGPPVSPPRAPEAVVLAVIPIPTPTAASPTAGETPPWPAEPAGPHSASLPSWADAVLKPLFRHAGTWGVGDGGAGPRLTRDLRWVGWAAVPPRASGSSPDTIAIWPHTGLCTGLPVIDDLPAFIAVTTARDLPVDWNVTGWWSDGAAIASLDGSIWLISVPGEPGIKFIERLDGATWPAGRYEFHVVDGTDTVALTICLKPADQG